MSKVVYAKLHTTVFVPHLGHLTDTLPPANKTLPNLAMSLMEDNSLMLTWGSNGRAVIPSANVQIAVLAPDEAKKTATK